MKKIKILFFSIILFNLSCNDKKSNMENYAYIVLYSEKDYLKSIEKIHEIEKTNDKEKVIKYAQVLLIALENDYKNLKNNNKFHQFFHGDINDEYEFTKEVLNSIVNGDIEFTGNTNAFSNYDIWKELYVKYNSSIFFKDWFVYYNPIKWKIDKSLFKYDYFLEPSKNDYLYNPEISDSYIISKYYYKINFLKLSDSFKKLNLTEIESYLLNNQHSNNILIFWQFDD